MCANESCDCEDRSLYIETFKEVCLFCYILGRISLTNLKMSSILLVKFVY